MTARAGLIGRGGARGIAAAGVRPGRQQSAAHREMPEAGREHQGGLLVWPEKIGLRAFLQCGLDTGQVAARGAGQEPMAEIVAAARGQWRR